MAYNYEDKLVETIKYIADSAVAAAPYDKTIRATILSCEDESIAKYKIRYQDAIFFAYGSSADVSFSPGTEVYVLIPNNDSTRDKTILGSTEKLGTNYVSIMGNDILYIPIGSNSVEGIKNYKLSSYLSEEKIIYNINGTVDVDEPIEINNNVLKKVLADTTHIRLGAKFSTNIPQEQQGGTGIYGINFTLKFLKNDGSLDRGEHGENCVSRNYMITINDLSNNPYTLTDFLQNKEFEIDGKNFLEVEKVSIFTIDFPYQKTPPIEEKYYDINIGDFQIIAIKKIDEASSGGAWMVITAPEGPYFDNTHAGDRKKKLETTIYVGGKIVNPQSQKVNYYWFVEDVRVNSNWEDKDFYNKNYCKYGGQGWRCLNNYNIIQSENDNKQIIEWVSGNSYLEVFKRDILSQDLRYKCVAEYNNLILNYEISIHNYDSTYQVNVTSSAGELFYFDSGTTNLTCTVKNLTSDNIIYVWGATDYLGNEHYFQNITTQGGVIVGNEIQNLPIYEIVKYSTYKCSAFLNDNLLGIGSITLTNSMEQGGQYSLVIKNGTQIFKYNENGVAPNENPDGTPFVFSPLGFILYDSLGKEIDHEFLNNDYEWVLPMSNTLLNFADYQEEPYYDEETEEYYIRVKGQDTITYSIAKQYNYNYTNNTIRLEVNYQGAVFIANTNFTFTKEGEDGTNGTDYFCRIVPNYSGEVLSYPLLALRKETTENIIFSCNGKKYSDYTLGNFLKVEFYENGMPVTLQSNQISWEILRNHYYTTGTGANKKQYCDKSYIGYNNGWVRLDNNYPQTTTGSKDYILNTPSPALVIKATVNYNNAKYYATYPLNWLIYKNISYLPDWSWNIKGGFRNVVYASDGTRPQYQTEPFKLIIKNSGGVDISKNLAMSYNWEVYGYLYNKKADGTWEWVKQENIGFHISTIEGEKNKIKITPPDRYDGHCVNFIIKCTILNNTTVMGTLQIPIHMMLNRYGHAALNDWDGNSVSIDKDGNGVILAPQVGAGQKNTDPTSEYYNSFTGILMRKS